jgi:hypothetical protein
MVSVSVASSCSRNNVMSTPSPSIALMLSCVALVCVALFQSTLPAPGSPLVEPVLVW